MEYLIAIFDHALVDALIGFVRVTYFEDGQDERWRNRRRRFSQDYSRL